MQLKKWRKVKLLTIPETLKKTRKVLIQYNSAQKIDLHFDFELINIKKQIP